MLSEFSVCAEEMNKYICQQGIQSLASDDFATFDVENTPI